MGAICLDEELEEMGGALLGKWFACGRALVGEKYCPGTGAVWPLRVSLSGLVEPLVNSRPPPCFLDLYSLAHLSDSLISPLHFTISSSATFPVASPSVVDVLLSKYLTPRTARLRALKWRTYRTFANPPFASSRMC
jgi:hypothetical protein